MEPIRFYRLADPYGEFSNFAPFPFTVNGRRWPTSEHYFQAQKFAGTPHEEEIRRAKFGQHEGLRKTLLSTGDAPILEHTANDGYWGDGGDSSGRNKLGILLMTLRSELRGSP